jgi:hypothetical protein
MRLEACNYVGFPLGELCFSIAQGIFRGVESFSKISDTSSIFLGLYASFLAGLKPLLQFIGALLGKMQRL